MASFPVLPQELYDEIIAHLWDDGPALRAVSTSARFLAAPAQKHIFAHIVLHSPSLRTSRTAPRLRDLFARSPHLAEYVSFLEVCGRETPAFAFHAREDALMFCLPLMTRLKALRVGYRMDLRRECLLFGGKSEGGDGGNTCAEGGLAGVLIGVLRLPTLVCVEFTHLPIELVAHCRELKALALQDADTYDPVVREWASARDAATPALTPATRAPVALASLQLDYVSTALLNSLHTAGFTLGALERLSIGALDSTDTDCTAGLSDLLRECAASLTALELDAPRMMHVPSGSRSAKEPAPSVPWYILQTLQTLRMNLAYPDAADEATDDDDAAAPTTRTEDRAGRHLLWLAHLLARLTSNGPVELEEVILQDYTDYWDYFAHDIYVGAWARIVSLLSDRARFPKFTSLVIDSKRCVTAKIQLHILDTPARALPFSVRLGPGQLPSKLGRSFLSTLFGRDWQASDI